MEEQKFDVYKVYDDEWEAIMGKGMLIEFAEQRATECEILANYEEDEIENYYKDTAELIKKIEQGEEEVELTFNQAVAILDMANYGVEIITLY